MNANFNLLGQGVARFMQRIASRFMPPTQPMTHIQVKLAKNLLNVLLRNPDQGSCATQNPHVIKYTPGFVLLCTPLRAARDRS